MLCRKEGTEECDKGTDIQQRTGLDKIVVHRLRESCLLAVGLEFTQPRDHYFAQPCTSTSREIDGRAANRSDEPPQIKKRWGEY